MSTYLVEEEAGVYSGRRHPHNGYYAGDFATAEVPTWGRVPVGAFVRTQAHPAETGRR